MRAYPTAEEQGQTPGATPYALMLPKALILEMQRLAEVEETTLIELIRRVLTRGLVLTTLIQQPDVTLLLRTADQERELVLTHVSDACLAIEQGGLDDEQRATQGETCLDERGK
jgi:hypothetical protein